MKLCSTCLTTALFLKIKVDILGTITSSLNTCSLLWKVSLSLQIMTSPFLVTSVDTRPLEVPSQLTSLFLSSNPTWCIATKRTILYTWLSWQCHLKITSSKFTIVRLRNIETLFLIYWIMDSPLIWLVLKLDHVVSLPLKTSGTLTKYSLTVIPSHLIHSGRNSAKWPFWPAKPSGTLGAGLGLWKSIVVQRLIFFLSWRCPLLLLGSFLNFFASHLLLLYLMFLCVYSPAPMFTSRPGL